VFGRILLALRRGLTVALLGLLFFSLAFGTFASLFKQRVQFVGERLARLLNTLRQSGEDGLNEKRGLLLERKFVELLSDAIIFLATLLFLFGHRHTRFVTCWQSLE
jgi:hypothetical protein